MTEQFDREAYRAMVVEKLQPARVRSTLAFAGLYQLTHEMIKDAVLAELRNFYVPGIDPTRILIDEQRYATEVLALAPKNKMRASLLWFVNAEAITQSQADRLDQIYDHRHDLTHELGKYIVDPSHEPDATLFLDAAQILRDVLRFWVTIEIDGGSFVEHGDIDVDQVVPGRLLLLQTCVDAYVGGLAPSEGTGSPDAADR